MSKRLTELVDGLKAERSGFKDVEIKGVTCDSRQVRVGSLFVAVPGTKADGRAFIDDAVSRGATAVVAEAAPATRSDVPLFLVKDARVALAELAARFHGWPTEKLNVVGVTGTKGKTTTAYLVRSILGAAGQKVGLLGTIENSLGGRTVPSPMTTPSAEDIQRYFAEMLANGCRSAVMEVSSHALAQHRTHGVRFAAGIFTNLTRDHLDYHKTITAYRAAKAKLFEQLTPKSLAVLNADDAASTQMAARAKGRVVTYALDAKAAVGGRIERFDFGGMRLRLRLGTEEVALQSRLIGRHNAYNLLAAAATTWAMGYDVEQIKAGLEGLPAVPGRLEPVDAGQPFAVVVDYAHTEDSLRNVLACVRPMAQAAGGRVLLVFGCGGDRDRGKRPKMGTAAEELADFFILTSDNPRRENPLTIIKEIEAGLTNHSKYLIEPDRAAAIRIAVRMAQRGDIVVIAGKGHETYQICGEQVRAFDDRLVARDILGERKEGGQS
jgi:UDP-N-acetylmuramoyl-L-alanyl-D-glutamate--2,6-diaminopimelate ligase